MTLPLAAAAIALIVIALYAVFGGADFGGGVWDLLASGPRREAQRDTISNAIGPVWESNHVWLIFLIVVMFTCFPPAFADLMTYLNAPLTLALIGIVLRGAAFVFRNYASDSPAMARNWTITFGIASILAPFFLGDAAGAVAAGDYAWLSPFAFSVGLFAVALFAQVAAVFLLQETPRGRLRDDFRRRAIRGTVAVWVVGLLPATLARSVAPQFFAALTSLAAATAIAIAVLLGIAAMVLVARGNDQLARVAVGAEVVAVLGGWFGAQAPAIVPGRWTIDAAAASPPMLQAFLIATLCGAVVLIPSLVLLFAVFKGPISSR
ncbi:cytochrome D ubiquinol oxidase subunit II [Vulcanimicrobium alpinum]|uniref:Cytochrome D ubiquinol oxidase subunit II n=1 Tax=Vulcanimicrobium alpinum TaxID=3016050 RepID=A0AAN1XS11_UNVUL|nr:cytochrome d ubiquinol oxidase subunit II [Vulcanimicrobium alpinum]BDE04863.1 cytochrome D ubiquinol oxidase subunit II [Vulcanimicrobium alpinum]